MYRTIGKCRICGNSRLDPVLDLGQQALTGVFPRSRAEVVPRMPLELVRCAGDPAKVCGLVQLRHSAPPEAMYGGEYGYRSSLNRHMVSHLHAQVSLALQRVAVEPGDVILDIGSNDGTLLRGYPAGAAQLVGMDPTAQRFREGYPSGAVIIPDFFSASRFREAMGDRRARIVTSMAMFYDLEEPLAFMKDVKDILHDEGLWVFEQSYLPAMLATKSFDTVCHEHLEYYGLRQIHWMAREAGLRIVEVAFNDVNGGSFTVTAAREGSSLAAKAMDIGPVLRKEADLGLDEDGPYRLFRGEIEKVRTDLLAFLAKERAAGRLVLGYGASTKGNVLLQYCGLNEGDLPCIAEVNAGKFGAFTPGTGIPIVSEAEAKALAPDSFLVLPWHFRAGILEREQAFLASGGRMIFPLPTLESVGRG